MLWLAWRQHRVMLVGLLGATVALAIFTAFATAYATRLSLELGVDTCVPLPNTNVNCVDLSVQWRNGVGFLQSIFQVLYVVPALVASYVGGPLLAREIERGTHRLAWTQGISRLRWGSTLVAVVIAFTLAAAVALASVGGQTRILLGPRGFNQWDTFDVEGPAFVSFTLFGVAVAAFLGAWRRRILEGMFYGLLAFGLVRTGVWAELRPNYEPPVAAVFTPVVFGGTFPPVFISPARVPAGAWQVGYDAVDGEGRTVPQTHVQGLLDEFSHRGCRPLSGETCDSVVYLNQHDVYPRALYQPADRYWRFQLYEAALYLALTVGFVALTLVMLRRRDA